MAQSTLGRIAWRLWNVDGVPASGPHEPDKQAEIFPFVDDLETRLEGLEDGQGGSLIAAATWTALAAITGSFAGQAAEVPSTDAGNHTDPVVGGTKANAGRYAWSASPAGWKWISADALSGKAPINSPAFTGTPTAPTATLGDNSTKLATTGFVKAAIDALKNGVDVALDTLAEIATALALKAPINAPTFTGTPALTTTPTLGDNTHKLADTAFVTAAVVASNHFADADQANYGLENAAVVVSDTAAQAVVPVTADGRSDLPQTALASILTEKISDLSPNLVIERGGRGTIERVRRVLLDGLVYYYSDILGAVHRFVHHWDYPGHGHMLDTSSELIVAIGAGQSWRTTFFAGVKAAFGDNEQERLLTFWNDVVIGPHLGAGVYVNAFIDITGMRDGDSWATDIASGIAFARIRARAKLHQVPLFWMNDSQGASGWHWDSGGYSPPGLAPGTLVWGRLLTYIAALPAFLTIYKKTPVYRAWLWTQGGDFNTGYTTDLADLADMCSSVDALALPGTDKKPMQFYIGQGCATSTVTTVPDSVFNHLSFCRTNANGRSWLSTPWYFVPYDGSGIHWTDKGTMMYAEAEGYARYVVEDLGLPWNPLWRSGTAISRSGQVITIPLARPAGPDFAAGVLSFDTTTVPAAGAPTNKGFAVKRSGSFLTVTSVVISGLNIQLTIADTLSSSDVLEISYAKYGAGDGGANPNGFFAGVRGNLKMAGPASVLRLGATHDAWLVHFAEPFTVP